jgi:hypothetical protein
LACINYLKRHWKEDYSSPVSKWNELKLGKLSMRSLGTLKLIYDICFKIVRLSKFAKNVKFLSKYSRRIYASQNSRSARHFKFDTL